MRKILSAFLLMSFFAATVNAQEVVIIKKNNNDSANKPLIIVDGVITVNKNMDDISPNDIKSINVFKGKAALDKYGDKGTNGVIEITSKKPLNSQKIDTSIKMTVIVDGDKVTINGVPVDKNDPRIFRNRIPIKVENKRINRDKLKMDSVIVEDLTIEDEDDEEGMNGFNMLEAPPSNAAFLGVITEETEQGAKINTVSESSPAEKAGLKIGDIITKLNEVKIKSPKDLYEAVGKCKAEDKVIIAYVREGKANKATAVLAKNKATDTPKVFNFSMPNGSMPNNLRRGFRINPNQNFNFEMPELPNIEGLNGRVNKRPKLGISIEDLESGEGVRIKNVTNGSPAEKSGLKANDIIVSYDEKKIKDVSDLKWEYLQEGQILKFTIQRGTEKKNIEVKIPRKLKTADL
jgi:serine protease Do